MNTKKRINRVPTSLDSSYFVMVGVVIRAAVTAVAVAVIVYGDGPFRTKFTIFLNSVTFLIPPRLALIVSLAQTGRRRILPLLAQPGRLLVCVLMFATYPAKF